MEEVETYTIPSKVKKVGKDTWDGNICINFAAGFLECMYFFPSHKPRLTAPRVENNHHARWDVENSEG